ncbi:hypothetical protein B0A53_06218 [Rhodotorula sp. CCFEE 5036]|nr:hypothetical protein B0A53_06218 [Rhodotorula sp. CCFEE 5036]
MLDRFPTELITLIIDVTSTSAWQRKALIDSLSSVSKRYRRVMRPLRESIVHVPRADVIPTLRSWPPARRKAVVTVTVGTDDHAQALEPFNLRDYSRLLSILPHVKHVYVRRVQESHYYNFLNSLSYQQMWFEMISSNPFRQCLSLCVRQARWRFPPTLESARFKLHRLRLELVLTDPDSGDDEDWGAGLEQFLTTQCLPCLRELRLFCRQLPKISTDFINQLEAAQVDFCRTANVESSGIRQMGPFSAPVLFSFDPLFLTYRGPKVQGIVYAHVRSQYIWLHMLLQDLPNLKAIGYSTLDPTVDFKNLELPGHPFAFAKQQIKSRSIELFAPGSGDDDFVNAGFLDFLRSRGPQT